MQICALPLQKDHQESVRRHLVKPKGGKFTNDKLKKKIFHTRYIKTVKLLITGTLGGQESNRI